MEGISLRELLSRVKKSVTADFPWRYWVRAEVRSVSDRTGSHCYLDLADRDESGVVGAQARGIIWASSWRVLKPYFIRETGRTIEQGMNLLFHAQVQFSEVYGFSLIIDDLDPTYTVGGLELARLRTIERLKKEGMMDMNSSLELVRLPRRFAVVSSPGAAGWGDFRRHLDENEYGFKFSATLYESLVQGTDAPGDMIGALERILADMEAGAAYDAVLIMRGGGSAGDLSCFDDYDLCANIAQFPLPVMTAVGHDRDYHVCDMVSCVSVKTPTALADYILDIFMAEDRMLVSMAGRLAAAVKGKVSEAASKLELHRHRLTTAVSARFQKESGRLDILEMAVQKNDPVRLMKSGYSLVRSRGMVLTSIEGVETGENLEVMLKDGILRCRVENVERISLAGLAK